MPISRRDLLRLAVAGGGVAFAVGDGTCEPGARQPRTAGTATFDRALAIPPVAKSSVDADGRRVFDLTAHAGTREFVPGQRTSTWGINGDYLGPTLRARRGEWVRINLHNELGETTSLHWHGMHLPAAADGGPHQPVDPGQTWSPGWEVKQPATTLWYHPHPHGRTEKHVYRGLAGLFVIDDDVESALTLPRRYGVDDLPVIIQDKRFDGAGQFDEAEHGPTGLLGDTLLVNGTLNPYRQVVTEKVRLRLLNASTARIYNLGFADGRRFQLIGTDGGLLATPFATDRIQLSPAERAEVVVSFRPGERVVLRSYPSELHTVGIMSRLAGGDDTFDVLELRAARTLAPSADVPARLADVPRPDGADATTIRSFRLSERQINGKKMKLDRIDEVVRRDSTEIWEVTNQHAQPHSFHVHDVQFRVLSIGGGAPPPELTGWKDTVYLPPETPVRIIMRFADYADPNVPYMYHCHLLLHEDAGMMGQFVVVEPGQEPGKPGHHHDG
ncbi:MAG TPA: multicopper oxidase domain-containing protein [Kribbella sp.]|nr:multicopper oxidase domain-containing protein [Kribbella sp.]